MNPASNQGSFIYSLIHLLIDKEINVNDNIYSSIKERSCDFFLFLFFFFQDLGLLILFLKGSNKA